MLEDFYNIIKKIGNYQSLFDNFIYIDMNKNKLINTNNKKEYIYNQHEEHIIRYCLKNVLQKEIIIFLNDKKNEAEKINKNKKSENIKLRKNKQQDQFKKEYNNFYKN